MLKYYGYGNELANQNFQEPESPHVYEPESPGIKVDEYEQKEEKEDKVEEERGSFIK